MGSSHSLEQRAHGPVGPTSGSHKELCGHTRPFYVLSSRDKSMLLFVVLDIVSLTLRPRDVTSQEVMGGGQYGEHRTCGSRDNVHYGETCVCG